MAEPRVRWDASRPNARAGRLGADLTATLAWSFDGWAVDVRCARCPGECIYNGPCGEPFASEAAAKRSAAGAMRGHARSHARRRAARRR